MKIKNKKMIALCMIFLIVSCSFAYADENNETPSEQAPPVTEPGNPIEPVPPVTEPENPIEPVPPVTEPETPTEPTPPVVKPTYPQQNNNAENNIIYTEDNSEIEVQGKENLFLESMNTSVGTLKPAFSPEHLNYIVYVKNPNAICDIQAAAKNSDYEIVYRGEYNFSEKVLERQVDVIGNNGENLRYTIRFVKIDAFDFFNEKDQTLYSLGIGDKLENKSKDLDLKTFDYKGKSINILKSKEYNYSITMGTDYENKASVTWFIYDEKSSSFLPANVKEKGKKITFKVNDDVEIKITIRGDKFILEDKVKTETKKDATFIAVYILSALILVLLISIIAIFIKKKRQNTKIKSNWKKPYLSLSEEDTGNIEKERSE